MSKAKKKKSFFRKLLRRLRSLIHRIRQHELSMASFFIFSIAIIGAIGVIIFERNVIGTEFTSLREGIWWAIVTITTVGYGDLVPTTSGGKVVGAIIMLSGVGLVSMFTAAVSSFIITKRMREGKGLQKIREKNHILLCGWSSIAEDVLYFLRDAVQEEDRSIVLVNELSENAAQTALQRFHNLQLKYIHGDFTEEAVLRRSNVQDAYAAVVIPDESSQAKKSDERTILATLSIKAIEPNVKVTAHILDPSNEAHLQRASADKIVVSDRHSGYLLASHINTPGVPEVLDSLLSGSAGMRLGRRKVPTVFRGKTVAELVEFFEKEKNATLIGFVTEEAEVRIDDILSGDYSSIDHFIKMKFQQAGRRMPRKARIDVNLNPPPDYVIQKSDIAIVIEPVG